MKKLITIGLLALALAVTSCSDDTAKSSKKDKTAPTVSSTVPAKDATSVAINGNITATFSEAMDPDTINITTFISTKGATPVIGAVTYTGIVATFNPTGNLAVNTEYTVTITTGATDVAGNGLAVNKTWSFKTGATADSTAPEVDSTVPVSLPAAINVAVGDDITATFSEAMAAGTIDDTTFTLTETLIPANVVSGVVSYLGLVATFNPTGNLAENTQYTATITTGVTDMANNALETEYTWSFTTIAGAIESVCTAGTLGGTDCVDIGAEGDLATAAGYAVLASSGITNVPLSATSVTGNMGLSPIAYAGALTGFDLVGVVADAYFTSTFLTDGFVYTKDNLGGTTTADLGTAVIGMGTAYTIAVGRSHSIPDATYLERGSGNLATLTLPTGVYEWAGNVSINDNITISGSSTDVWIFKIGGNLNMVADKQIILDGGAQPSHIFWAVGGTTVTLLAGAQFKGIILGGTTADVTLGSLTSIDGRILSQTAVHFDTSTVTQP